MARFLSMVGFDQLPGHGGSLRSNVQLENTAAGGSEHQRVETDTDS